MKKILTLIFCAVLLQSCMSTYGSGTKDSVNVYTTFPLVYLMKDQTQVEADKHCAQYKKKAVLVDTTFIMSQNAYKCQ